MTRLHIRRQLARCSNTRLDTWTSLQRSLQSSAWLWLWSLAIFSQTSFNFPLSIIISQHHKLRACSSLANFGQVSLCFSISCISFCIPTSPPGFATFGLGNWAGFCSDRFLYLLYGVNLDPEIGLLMRVIAGLCLVDRLPFLCIGCLVRLLLRLIVFLLLVFSLALRLLSRGYTRRLFFICPLSDLWFYFNFMELTELISKL